MSDLQLTTRESLHFQIRQTLDELHTTLPNNWTVRIDASDYMMERLVNWMEAGQDTLDDVLEEAKQALDVIVAAYEVAGFLLPNDRLLGDRLGEYVITGRQFFALDKQVVFEIGYYEKTLDFDSDFQDDDQDDLDYPTSPTD